MKTIWSAVLSWSWWCCLLAGLVVALVLHARISDERENLATQVPRISRLRAFDRAVAAVADAPDEASRAGALIAAEQRRSELDAVDVTQAEPGAILSDLAQDPTQAVAARANAWVHARTQMARRALGAISARLDRLWSAMYGTLVAALALAFGAALVAVIRRVRLGSTQRRVAQLDHVLTTLLGGAPIGLFALDEEGRFQVLAGAITASWRTAGSEDAPAWERLAEHVALAQALKSGHESGELTTAASVGDRRLDLSFSRVASGQNSDLKTLGVVVDLSARVARRGDARFSEDEERFESLGSIAGGIAHEFNNLLVGILGYAHLAGLEAGTPPAVHRHLSRIEDSGKRAGHIVQKLMASAGHARIDVESVRLADLVHEALDTIDLPESVQLDELVMHKQSVAYADPEQFRQVVVHLVQNAIEAIGSGADGRITVRTGQSAYSRSDLSDARAGSPTLVAGPYAYVEVSDSGSGMDPDTENHMFDPYFSTRFPGRGLGLSAVYGIVRRHHGALFVRTAPGKGTIVRVALPAEPPPATPKRTPAAQPRAGTVLVVEQDRPIQAYVNAVLQRRGFDVLRATDGVEALALYAQRVGTVDVVLLDVSLADPDSQTVLHDMRGRRPEQPIILMGERASQMLPIEPSGRTVGWLAKPFKVEALLRAVRAAMPVTNGSTR